MTTLILALSHPLTHVTLTHPLSPTTPIHALFADSIIITPTTITPTVSLTAHAPTPPHQHLHAAPPPALTRSVNCTLALTTKCPGSYAGDPLGQWEGG